MTHHRNTHADEPADCFRHGLPALDFNAVCASFLQEAACIPDGLLGRHLEGEEGHVRDEERSFHSARGGLGVVDHLVDGDGEGRLVSCEDHGAGVADEDEVDSGRVQE